MDDADLRADLDAWMEDPEPHESSFDDWEDRAPELLADEAAVNRALRRRQRLVRESERVVAIAHAEAQQRQAWVEDRCAGINRQLDWIDRGLAGYMREVAKTTRRRSLPLPSGTLKLTKPGQTSLVVNDLEAFVAWVDADPERAWFVKREPKPVAASIKDALTRGPKIGSDGERDVFSVVDEDGAVVPGVTLTLPTEDRFSVTASAQDEPNTNPQGAM